MRLLIDEHLSPQLVVRLAEKGIYSQHVAHVGLAGRSDSEIWLRAYRYDQIMVTMNVGDFVNLAAGVELHPGLIVIRASGLSREEQYAWLEPVLDRIAGSTAALVNRVVEVYGVGDFEIRDLPTDAS